MNKIRKDDIVKVIAGKDKGKEGKVLLVDIKNKKVVVDKINMVSKHAKAGKVKGINESTILKREAPIDISNVMLLAGKETTKVGFKKDGDNKVRIAKKTGKVIK